MERREVKCRNAMSGMHCKRVDTRREPVGIASLLTASEGLEPFTSHIRHPVHKDACWVRPCDPKSPI